MRRRVAEWERFSIETTFQAEMLRSRRKKHKDGVEVFKQKRVRISLGCSAARSKVVNTRDASGHTVVQGSTRTSAVRLHKTSGNCNPDGLFCILRKRFDAAHVEVTARRPVNTGLFCHKIQIPKPTVQQGAHSSEKNRPRRCRL